MTSRKFIEVVFKDSLNWSEHVLNIHTEVSPSFGSMCKSRKFAPVYLNICLFNHQYTHDSITAFLLFVQPDNPHEINTHT